MTQTSPLSTMSGESQRRFFLVERIDHTALLLWAV